jgi:hypothetical protein
MANTGYTLGRNDVITEALELLGALAEGESPSANQITSLSRTMNILLKHWQAQGVNLYAVRETFLFLLNGIFKYDQLDFDGTTGLDVDRKHIYVSDYQKIAFAESSTTVVTVNEAFIAGSPVAAAVATDVLGIPLADGTMHWAEITAVGTSGAFSKSYTFANHALTLSTDPDITKDLIVATVYPGRPIKLLDCYLRQFYTDEDRRIEFISSSDLSDIPNKNGTTNGVNQVYYNRKTTTGDLRTWGTIDSPYYCLGLWAQIPLSDIESDANLNTNAGIPQEYFLAYAYSLAEAVAPKYGPPPDVLRSIRSLAAQYRDEAFAYDTSDVSTTFQPDMMGR